MAEVRFYQLGRRPLEQVLATMLERTLERGQRAVVLAGGEERVEALAQQLWTYAERSFLPHGTARDGLAERQPVWIAAEEGNPNGAEVLFLLDGQQSDRLDSFALVAVIFDGGDGERLTAARGHWQALKGAGHQLTYWEEDAEGRWQKRA